MKGINCCITFARTITNKKRSPHLQDGPGRILGDWGGRRAKREK